MPEPSRRDMEIPNALGLHLRAATRFVQLSHQFQAEVRVFCNGNAANGRSVLDLLTLVAECGARLELEVIGPDADAAIHALCALIQKGFQDGEDGRNESSLA
jgi:phosphotransferase system HPr (HPr) family protein